MITWIFGGITLASAGLAAFLPDLRRATLSLWAAGLALGALYLTLGAELLAIVQWMVSTLVAISFVFFGVMFGESDEDDSRSRQKKAAVISLAVVAGLGFSALIWLGSRGAVTSDQTQSAGDMLTIGRVLVHDHLLSLEVLALTLFLVLIGCGVIARPEGGEETHGGQA